MSTIWGWGNEISILARTYRGPDEFLRFHAPFVTKATGEDREQKATKETEGMD